MKKSLLFILPIILSSLSSCSTPAEQEGYHYDNVSNESGSMSYEIFVRSFYDSDGNGVGDINGVTLKLPYLYDLGIKTIWLMPIHKSPSYHGYDVSNYYSVHNKFGTLEDFDNLVKEAKKYNIDIMLDMVFNHCSNKNTYFTDSYNDYKEGKTGSDSKANWFNWSTIQKEGYNKYQDLYYESRFSSTMPDFNLDCQAVRDEIENIMKFWIVDHEVKGFRLDAVLYYYYGRPLQNYEFLDWLEETAHKYDPNFYMVGEAWTSDDSLNEYYNSKLDSFFRFDSSNSGTYYNLINLAKGNVSSSRLYAIEENEKLMKENNPSAYSSYFLSNHDQDRVSKNFNEIQNKVAASLLCLMPGTPFMYYGEEIMLKGIRGTGVNTDATRRLPMIWSEEDKTGECVYPEPSSQYIWDGDQVKLGVIDQLKDGFSLVNHYKKAINIRNKYSFLKHGNFSSLMSELDPLQSEVIAYKISLDNEYIKVYTNVTNEEVTIEVSGNEILDEINTSKTFATLKGHTLTIAPYSTVVMK